MNSRRLQAARYAVPADIFAGLTATPKSIPCKYFYDDAGAELFERICTVPEYYPTRTEIGILRAHMPAIDEWVGAHARVVEFGSGSGEKTRVLLRGLSAPREYIPVDICLPQLIRNAQSLRLAFPELTVSPWHADYTRPLRLRPAIDANRTIVFFPGSTIGNFEPLAALDFLRRAACLAGSGGGLLIGVDLKKDAAVLNRAYNDAEGVTAAFNLNILSHVNTVCGSDFDPACFEHLAFYNAEAGRIEMHLRSTTAQRVILGDGLVIDLGAGELIATEHSYKYDGDEFVALAEEAGFSWQQTWTDAEGLFSIQAFESSLLSTVRANNWP